MLYFVYGSLKTRVKKQVSIIIDSIFKDEEKNVVELDFNECDIFSLIDKILEALSKFEMHPEHKNRFFELTNYLLQELSIFTSPFWRSQSELQPPCLVSHGFQ